MSWRRPLAVALVVSLAACTPTVAPSPTPAPQVTAQAAPPAASPSAPAAAADVYNLTLAQYKAASDVQNFEIVGHSYFAAHLAPGAKGAAFNTPRVSKGIAYLAGYPQSLYGVIVADVRDPANMKEIAFIPAHPGTRTAYVRLNVAKNILVVGYDANATNPAKAPVGEVAKGGFDFFDVSNPSQPAKLGEFIVPQGATHGFEIDDRYVYGCASTANTKSPLFSHLPFQIIDYSNPRLPTLVSTYHIQGQWEGETYAPQDQQNPDGTPQVIWCHEVNKDGNRLYIAWRDAGLVTLDVTDPKTPKLVGRYDFVPPFNGGSLGSAHTAAIVPHTGPSPTLLVENDEIFACPAGAARVIDITDPGNAAVVSSIRVAASDTYDWNATDSATGHKGTFVCPPGQQSSHQPYFPPFGNGSLFFEPWYGQGLRAFDISNPFQPKEVGRFVSPNFTLPPTPNTSPYADANLARQTREAFVDPDTQLIYVTDGNGGGLTVLRWTGPIPDHPPIPAVR